MFFLTRFPIFVLVDQLTNLDAISRWSFNQYMVPSWTEVTHGAVHVCGYVLNQCMSLIPFSGVFPPFWTSSAPPHEPTMKLQISVAYQKKTKTKVGPVVKMSLRIIFRSIKSSTHSHSFKRRIIPCSNCYQQRHQYLHCNVSQAFTQPMFNTHFRLNQNSNVTTSK